MAALLQGGEPGYPGQPGGFGSQMVNMPAAGPQMVSMPAAGPMSPGPVVGPMSPVPTNYIGLCAWSRWRGGPCARWSARWPTRPSPMRARPSRCPHHDSCAHAFTHPVSPGPTVLVPVQEETTVRIGEGGTRDLPAGSDFVLFVAYLPILGLYLFLFSELGFGATVFKTLTLHSDWAMVSASGGVCVCICARRARARARLPCARVC